MTVANCRYALEKRLSPDASHQYQSIRRSIKRIGERSDGWMRAGRSNKMINPSSID